MELTERHHQRSVVVVEVVVVQVELVMHQLDYMVDMEEMVCQVI